MSECTKVGCGCTCHKKEEPKPRMYWDTSAGAGGCNFCVRHIHPKAGVMEHKVLVVHSAGGGVGLQIRFCEECAEQFWETV